MPLFPALPLAPLTAGDIALVALMLVGLPLLSALSHWRDGRMEAAGGERRRMARYGRAFLVHWGLTGLVLAVWLGADRPPETLGLAAPASWAFFIAMALAALASLAFASQIVMVRRSAEARADVARQIAAQPGLARILPRTRTERAVFSGLALSAGIAEEILFRGFLIWALAQWFDVWTAAAIAALAFTALHAYQESLTALMRVGAGAVVMTLLAMLSGSLLPGMLLHAVVDLTSNEMAWAVRRKEEAETDGDAAQPQNGPP